MIELVKYLYVDIKLFSDDDNTNNNVSDSTQNNDEDLSAYNDIFGIEDGELEEYAKRINGEVNYSDDVNNELEHQQNDDEAEPQENNIETTADNNSAEENNPDNKEDNSDDKTELQEDFKALYEKAKAELDALKNNQNQQQNNNVINNTAQHNMQFNQGVSVNQNANMQGFKITPELAQTINNLIQERAIKISGLNKDEIDALEYADDDDTNKMRYEQAKSMARNMVMQDVNNKYIELQNRMQYQQTMSRAIADETQKFVNEIKGTENYQNIMNYATAEGLKKYSPYEQTAIREAYAKVNAGVGNASDMMVLRSFWNKSVTDFNSNNNISTKDNTTKVKEQINKKNKMPRVSQLQGSGSNKGNIWTIDKIKDTLNRGAIDEIPPNIQQQIEKGMLL